MDTLWAPWRMEFIQQEQPQGCIFCLFPADSSEGADEKNLILGRTTHAFAILNKFPYNNGHLMVVPRRHTADFAGLGEEESADLHRLLQLSVSIVTEAYCPEGLNVGMNLGKSAGAGIPGHLHYHLVPRWTGDTNFMPVLFGTKVMIEHLSQSYAKLRTLFDQRLGG